jgi:hypothetical protein
LTSSNIFFIIVGFGFWWIGAIKTGVFHPADVDRMNALDLPV